MTASAPSFRVVPPSWLWVSIAAGAMLAAASPVRATPLTYSAGLVGLTSVITFDGLADGSVVGAGYAGQGVTFGGLFVTSQFGATLGGGTTAPAAANFDGQGTVNSPFTISFSTVMSDVAFFLATDGYGATITSSLAGMTVESTGAGSFTPGGDNYFGFTGSAFDTITVAVAGTGTAVIDNLQLGGSAPATVPEPATGGLLLAGLAGLGMVGARRRS